MMLKYLKESFHWLHLAFFKPITLEEKLTSKEAVKVYIKVFPVGLAIVLTLEVIIGVLAEALNCQFDWATALGVTLVVGLFFGLVVGLVTGGDLEWGWTFGLGLGLGGGLFVGSFLGLFAEQGGGFLGGFIFVIVFSIVVLIVDDEDEELLLLLVLAFGVIFGLGGGVLVGLVFGLLRGLTTMHSVDHEDQSRYGELLGGLIVGLIVGPSVSIIDWLAVRLSGESLDDLSKRGTGVWTFIEYLFEQLSAAVADKGLTQWFTVTFWYAVIFLLMFLRPFHLLLHAFQYWRSRSAQEPFKTFRNSPVYWDEVIAMPLPRLANWLVRLAQHDRERGLAEILFVASKRPYQRRAAQKALLTLAVQDLQRFGSIEEMINAADVLKFIPAEADYLPDGLNEARNRIKAISTLALDYLTRVTPVGQSKVLEELRRELESFRDAMILVKPPVGTSFQSIASRWLEIVKEAETKCRERMSFTPIPNPFIVGNPLENRDKDLFKGRKDIIVAIEENIINTGQKPSLLLYGRRRTGKTSTLLNLPRLLSSQFVPVFIDCQNAKWRDGDTAFCYHLAKTLFDELQKRDMLDGLRKPELEQFEKYAFTRLDEFLDSIENLSRSSGKRILLTFDEYERMEQGIEEAKITREIFNQLRNIIQHRQQIVALFSGSHRFEELKTVNWSDYLINVKTLELSFLTPNDAMELITEPVPNLTYESGVA